MVFTEGARRPMTFERTCWFGCAYIGSHSCMHAAQQTSQLLVSWADQSDYKGRCSPSFREPVMYGISCDNQSCARTSYGRSPHEYEFVCKVQPSKSGMYVSIERSKVPRWHTYIAISIRLISSTICGWYIVHSRIANKANTDSLDMASKPIAVKSFSHILHILRGATY